MKIPNPTLFLSTALAPLMAASAFAGTPTAPTTEDEKKQPPTAFDKLWGLATLYKNDKNPFLQELKLRGRYQGQYHWLDSDQGDEQDWENRRSRFGIDAKLFHQFELRFDVQSNDEWDPFYDRMVDAYIKWVPSDKFSLTVGRQKPQIAYYDFLQSTNNQPTFERSQIFNQLRVDRAPGAVAEYKTGRWTFQAGVYSNDVNREFGNFDGGASFGAGASYDLKDVWHLDKATARVDWLHSESESIDSVLNVYDDIVTATLWIKQGPWNVVGEAFYATGGAPDVFGLYIQPTYDLVPKRLQAVARCSFSTGDGPDSIVAQSRYERAAPFLTGGGRGDQYQAAYLGFQYFIYGDKLKFLGGVEWAHLNGGGNGGGFDSVTTLAGVRVSF
ncbi:MAG TPA: porin [Verrucomicrobiales bacterium]|nr:porin [Verrucomicrobiales bacterium]